MVDDRYEQGLELLRSGDNHAAALVLQQVFAEHPEASVREALARALYASGRFSLALEHFNALLERDAASDWAHFGAGLTMIKLGRLDEGAGHLRMALVMRPDNPDYKRAVQRLPRPRQDTG